MASTLHISISAEPIAYIGNFAVTNSIFTSLVVSALLISFAALVNSQLKSTDKPSGLQNFAEWIIESLHNLTHSITGDLKKTRLFFPVVASFFLYILINNWFGLIPGVGPLSVQKPEKPASLSQGVAPETANTTIAEVAADAPTTGVGTTSPEFTDSVGITEAAHAEDGKTTLVPIFRPGTADLNTTLAFAIISVGLTQLIGLKYLRAGYLKKYFNFSSPIFFFVGILELVSEFAKIISFAFRLFGNIFAGEVLLLVIGSLIPAVVPMPFYGLEIFVGFVQALVFSMLTVVFFNMATIGHAEDH